MTTTTITATVPAWLTRAEKTDMRKLDEKKPEDVIGLLAYFSDDMTSCGWVKAGTATITVTLEDANAINSAQVAILQEAKRKVMADSQAAINCIEGQIQNLLCLDAPQ